MVPQVEASRNTVACPSVIPINLWACNRVSRRFDAYTCNVPFNDLHVPVNQVSGQKLIPGLDLIEVPKDPEEEEKFTGIN